MSEIVKKRNEILIKSVIDKLKERNMEGFYAADKKEALDIAHKLLEGAKSSSCGGTMTLVDIGLMDELLTGKYGFIDRSKAKTPEDQREIYLKSLACDVYLGSVNAMTSDGVLVNIDGNSNRIAAYSYGPKKVVLIVGVQKITKDIDSAISRARNVAAPINCVRLNRSTPCATTGTCANCKKDTICCNFLITRYSRDPERIKVILVNESVGY